MTCTTNQPTTTWANWQDDKWPVIRPNVIAKANKPKPEPKKRPTDRELNRVLVTGGAGFIGTNLVRELIKQECHVTIVDNFSTGKRENLAGLPGDTLTVIDADITEHTSQQLNLVLEANYGEKYDAIFHLAAVARIQPSFKKPIDTYEINSTGTMKVLEFAKKDKIPVIYAGSSSFYHDIHANPYTYSKWLGEEHCKLYRNLYGVPTAIARFFNVYGPYQIEEGDYSTVIGIFERQKRENTPLTVTGTGLKRRDFTHVADIVNGLISIAKTTDEIAWGKDWDGGVPIYPFGTGKNHAIIEVARMFDHIIKFIPDRPGEAETTLANYSVAKEYLGWVPIHNLENYINEVIA